MANGLGNFGENVFSDRIMKEKLPNTIYKRLQKSIEEDIPLDLSTAEVIASVMKEWAIGLGATHYTHWFSPMTGKTAEKHEAFISPKQDGNAIYEFSGKALIQGEADASSFPSGGLRATFEARGYTAWDFSIPAFIRKDPEGITALCIPTLFCSFTGDALDTRIPLKRSIDALNKQALKVLHLLGKKTVTKVVTNVGLEQEYFLINRDHYRKRPDLRYTGRTLFGAAPPKGQELSDQYYGAVRQRVSTFMAELNNELWSLGIPAKTQHNEVAPAQHEVAVIFDHAIAACNQNELTMMILKKVAARKGMACLLHEKPFAGFNGSGKHNNWSLCTNEGENLLDPGEGEKAFSLQFLLFLTAVISGVDEHGDLLRFSCCGLGNDYRLGGNEAPPPIISIFLGDVLWEKLAETGGIAVQKNCERFLNHNGNDMGTLLQIETDDADRNRTSPFAFTGNKFEFRMPGSSQNPDTVNTIINTIVAQQLSYIAQQLEEIGNDEKAIKTIIKNLLTKHQRVIFNGNNYSANWRKEAIDRGLPIASSTAEAIDAFVSDKTMKLMEDFCIFSEKELFSRAIVQWEIYIKSIRIEAKTMVDMQRKSILPAVLNYQEELLDKLSKIENTSFSSQIIKEQLEKLEPLVQNLWACIKELENVLSRLTIEATEKNAKQWEEGVIPLLEAMRNTSDILETLLPSSQWPFPTYEEILYY